LGVLIRDARKKADLSIADCAARISLDPEQLEAFETGGETPSLPQLEAYAFSLGIPLDHFWGNQPFAEDQESNIEPEVYNRLYALRNRIIGVTLRKTRIEMGISSADLAETVEIPTELLDSYERGENAIPLVQLEGMAGFLGLPLAHFMDKDGFVGRWVVSQQHIQQFKELSPELQAFVTQPVNQPYLEIAQRLSEMSVEKLRSLAEGLLDITL
jgi:transcriptional regulator with XRE-family HTH domain